MKSIQTIRSLVLLAMLAVGAVSCQKEEFTATGGDAPQRTPLTISVTDGGYASGDPKTRATENGYATEFTAGDKIGLYVVKPDGTYAAENVALTLTDNGGGTLTWQAPLGTNLYYGGAAAKYFAYYPYQQSVTGSLAPSAATAAGFFADVVSQWSPATNQSTHALYTAQDLMVGSGTVSKQADAYTLSFTMTHAMALVVIETPTTKYTFTNNTPTISDYYIPAPNTTFYGFTPYSSLVGTYRLLVKPAQTEAANLTGSYTIASGNTKEYTIAQNNIAAANYHHYKVDGATVTAKSHILQPGDFYLKDGSLLGKGENPTAAQKAACIGIVFKVGKDESNDWKDDCVYMSKGGAPMSSIRGYVLALYDGNDGNNSVWSSYGTSVDDMNRTYTGFYGYRNTNAIKSFAKKNNMELKIGFPATYWATDAYEASYPAPANSSGWFLPSAGQCKYWLDNRDVLLESVRKVTGEGGYGWGSWYWSSSEDSRNPEYNAWCLSFNFGGMRSDYKDNINSVHSVLAF